MNWVTKTKQSYSCGRGSFWIGTILPALIGALLIGISMRQGPGVGGDATIYLTSARNLLNGHGLGLINPAGDFRFIPYFPPLYPLMLALFGTFGLDLVSVSFWINIVSFGLTLFAMSAWISHVADQQGIMRGLPGFVIGLFFAGSPILLPTYSWAMSEPLCIFWMVIGFLALLHFLKKGGWGWLISAAVCAGLSFLTRYSSVACLMVGCLMLLFIQRKSFRRQLLETVLFGVISALPMMIWLWIDWRVTETVASRSMISGVSLFSEMARFASQLRTIFLQWFLPDRMISQIPAWASYGLFCVVLLGTLIIFLRSLRAWRTASSKKTEGVILLSMFFFLYILVVMAVSVLTFPPITINPRMLLPAFLSFFLVLVWSIFDLPSGWVRRMLLLILILWAGFNGLRGVRIARQNALDGLGFNAVRWKNSETIAYLQERIPPTQSIVTNEETALLFLLDRSSWTMHEIYAQQPDDIFYPYEKGEVKATDKGRKLFQAGEALLVIFDTFEDQMAQIYGDQTHARIQRLLENLTIIADLDDGTVFALPAATESGKK